MKAKYKRDTQWTYKKTSNLVVTLAYIDGITLCKANIGQQDYEQQNKGVILWVKHWLVLHWLCDCKRILYDFGE